MDVNRLHLNPQESQSMAYLLQQINLYRELLNQVTYQNELLGRNMNQTSSMGASETQDPLQNLNMGGNGMRFRGFQQPSKET